MQVEPITQVADHIEDFPWVMLLIAIIAGLVGGCGAASYQVLSGRKLSIAISLAYITLGASLGGLAFVVAFMLTDNQNVESIIVIAGLIGGGGTVFIAGIRMGIQAILKWKGIELTVNVKRSDKG